jgi:hypothetical protein
MNKSPGTTEHGELRDMDKGRRTEGHPGHVEMMLTHRWVSRGQ